jgi:D-glycero-D-manno-heptose 1,7-bisphosphate phosphatase
MGIDALTAPRRPAIFLDRDGVITEDVFYPETGEWEAALHPDDLALRPGVLPALARFEAGGFALVLVSNQGAYAKGKVPLEDLLAVDRRLRALLAEAAIGFTDFHYSFSHPHGVVPGFSGPSLERKPSPYFLLLAAARHQLDLGRSWVIGDRDSDIECGQAAGTRTVLIDNPHAGAKAGASNPDFRCADLAEAAAMIVAGTDSTLGRDLG